LGRAMMWLLPFMKSLVYALMISSTYYFFGYSGNERYGYGQIQVDGLYVLSFALTVAFGVYLFRKEYDKPSDYFLLLYGMVVIIPYALLHDIRGGVSAIGVIAVVVPFFGVMFLCRLRLELSAVAVVSEEAAV